MNSCLSDADLERLRDVDDAGPWRTQAMAHVHACGTCQQALEHAVSRDRWLSERWRALDTGSAPLEVEAALASVTRRSVLRRRWRRTAVAGALAAAAVALLMLRVSVDRVAHFAPQPIAATPEPDGGFVTLDNAPIQMAVIVRVTLPPGGLARYGTDNPAPVQADLLVGEDGMPHAFRVVR